MSVDPPVLEGARVRLRAPAAADLPRLAGWYRDPELVAPFDRFALDRTETLAASIRGAPDDPTSLAPRYVIERRGDGAVVGCVGHYRSHPVMELLDVWYLVGEPTARGAGLGAEAVALLVDRLFASSPTARIGISSDVANLASVRLAERLGFRREGTLRDALYHHARWHDVALYGITRPEWAARPRAPATPAAAPPATAP